MRPPTASDQRILYSIIEENPAASLDALVIKTGLLRSEMVPTLRSLEACGLIRRDGLNFRPRERRRKPPPRASFLARFGALFSPPAA